MDFIDPYTKATFEILMDEDTHELIDVKYLDRSLSDLLPVIGEVKITASCSGINTLDFRCFGTTKTTFIKNEQEEDEDTQES